MAGTREELKGKLGILFNATCRWTLTGSHTVTLEQREDFIEEASKLFESPTIDLDWLIRALLRTRNRFTSEQERAVAILNGS